MLDEAEAGLKEFREFFGVFQARMRELRWRKVGRRCRGGEGSGLKVKNLTKR